MGINSIILHRFIIINIFISMYIFINRHFKKKKNLILFEFVFI